MVIGKSLHGMDALAGSVAENRRQKGFDEEMTDDSFNRVCLVRVPDGCQ
jgi:hypothetical protein